MSQQTAPVALVLYKRGGLGKKKYGGQLLRLAGFRCNKCRTFCDGGRAVKAKKLAQVVSES